MGLPQDRIEPRLHRDEREKVVTMTVAMVHVFAVPAQCQAHQGECHNNVDGPQQRRSPEDRLCREYLFVDGIHALPRLPSPECYDRIEVRLRFLV